MECELIAVDYRSKTEKKSLTIGSIKNTTRQRGATPRFANPPQGQSTSPPPGIHPEPRLVVRQPDSKGSSLWLLARSPFRALIFEPLVRAKNGFVKEFISRQIYIVVEFL
jgi:hypothetical protein